MEGAEERKGWGWGGGITSVYRYVGRRYEGEGG